MKYKDPKYSPEERTEDLLSRMTLDEKVAQLKAALPMTALDGDHVNYEKLESIARHGLGRMPQFTMASLKSAKEIARIYNDIQRYMVEKTRLGIPIITQVECLNGVMGPDAESFPSPIGLASTFSPKHIEETGKVVSRQMKAAGLRYGLSPVVDLARDPRWGRVYETYGEDTYLSSIMGTSMVKGMQQGDIRNNVASCAKHFLAYSVSAGGLNTAEVSAGWRELTEQHAAPYEAMIHEADLQGIMCTYSAIDGVPVSVSRPILTDLLRNRLGFDGTAVCDGGSIERAHYSQGIGRDLAEIAAMAVKAGLCADAPRTEAFHHLPQALERGLLTEEDIDTQVRLVLLQKFKLGLFDEPYVDISRIDDAYDRTDSARLNREICEQTITLLKNESNFLPLAKKTHKIAVIGPHGNDSSMMFAGYTYLQTIEMFMMLQKRLGATMQGVSSEIDDNANIADMILSDMGSEERAKALDKINEVGLKQYLLKEKYGSRSVFEAINEKCGGTAIYCRGSGVEEGSCEELQEALQIAKSSDIVILTVGGKCGWGRDATSGEGKDRMSLNLPEPQDNLLREVCKVNPNVVVVLFNGRPMSINYAAKNAPAIIEAWFPGPFGGEVIADIIFGEVNPSGKLPITIPRTSMQVPIFYSHKFGSGYDHDKSEDHLVSMFGGGYTDGEDTPLYCFGHGLSYTTFKIDKLSLDKTEADTQSKITISCDVENVGERKGSEVVQIYLAVRGLPVTRPIKQLVAFEKVELDVGEKAHIDFELPINRIGFVDEDLSWNVMPCAVEVQVGNSSDNISERARFDVVGQVQKYARVQNFFTKSKIYYTKLK
jgi:beta-glucosidase